MQLIFDFDGTLADSAPGIYASFRLACTRMNLKAPPFDTFRDSIGPPVQRLAQRFFPDLPEPDLEAFRLIFRQNYDYQAFRQCDWYESVKPTITALGSSPEVNLAIVTNKPTYPTLELLKGGGLLEYFQLVVGIDYQFYQGSGPAFATKADAIRFTYSHLDQGASSAFYIGDTPSDREASKACGLKFIAATYGFHSWQQDELSDTICISTITELIPLLQCMSGSALVDTT